MKRLRVGRLNFLNAIPLYLGLTEPSSGIALISGNPAELNDALSMGSLDISLVSSYAYLQHAESWSLVPGFGIAAEREVQSVNLYSRLPIAGLEGQTVAITSQSASAGALLRLLFSSFWNVNPEFACLDAVESATRHPAFMLIGDQALRHRHFDGYQTIDLAKTWYELTALPMTFAVFAARREVAENQQKTVELFAEKLNQSLLFAETNPKKVAALAAHQTGFSLSDVTDYYRLLRYKLGPREIEGLRTFAKLADLTEAPYGHVAADFEANA